MIKINDTKNCAERHYTHCIQDVLSKLTISILFFEIILDSNKKTVKDKSFLNTFKINSKSLNYFVNTYFYKKYRKKSKNQKETRVSLFESLFFQGNSYMVKVNTSEARKSIKFLGKIKTNINKILKGTPSELTQYLTKKSQGEQKHFKGLIEFIFSYEKLGNEIGKAFGNQKDWNSYALTKSLNVEVC